MGYILDLIHILDLNRGKHFEVTIPSAVAHSHVPPSTVLKRDEDRNLGS